MSETEQYEKQQKEAVQPQGGGASDAALESTSVDLVRNSFIIKPQILCILELCLGLFTFIGLATDKQIGLRITTGVVCVCVAAYTHWAIYKIQTASALVPCMVANLALYCMFFFGGMVVAATSSKSGGWSFEYMAVLGFLAYTIILVIAYISFLAVFALKISKGEAPAAKLPVSIETLLMMAKVGSIVQVLVGVFTLIGCAEYPEMWVTLGVLNFIFGYAGFKAASTEDVLVLKAHMFACLIVSCMYAVGVADACAQTKKGCRNWVYPFAVVTSFLGTALQVLMLYYLYRLFKAFRSNGADNHAETTYTPAQADVNPSYTSAGVAPTGNQPAPTFNSPSTYTSPYGSTYGSNYGSTAPVVPSFVQQQQQHTVSVLSQAAKQALAAIQDTARSNDYYAVFGVPTTATLETLAQKRKELNQKLHPDTDGGGKGYDSSNPFGADASDEEERKLAKINNIYTVVFKRAETKELYDTVVGYRNHYPRFASENPDMLKIAATNLVSLRTRIRNANFPSELVAELDSVIAWIRSYRNISF